MNQIQNVGVPRNDDVEALKSTLLNLLVNELSDDMEFVRKVNKITFGLMTDNSRF